MHAKSIILFGLCGGTAFATPRLQARDGDNDNDLMNGPWVTVNDEGNPQTTFTPTASTNTPPHDIAASVFTINDYGVLTTRTGLPPNPTVTNAVTNQGSFSRCFNQNGPFAPFCRPTFNSSIYVGTTYYVTWDPDHFNNSASSTTERFVSLRINFFNETSPSEKVEPVVFDKTYPSGWGYIPLKVEGSYLRGRRSQNVTLQLISRLSQNSSAVTNHTVELPVVLTNAPFRKDPPTPVPQGQTLYIALPTVFGAMILLTVGLCLWNCKTRRIALGNIMSRSRHGYTGRRHRAKNLFGGRRKDLGIQLKATPVSPPRSDHQYRDEAPDHHHQYQNQRYRRDSDDLGSLAGSPVRGTFEPQGTMGGHADNNYNHNAFRSELYRQERERRNEF
ncbi:hypothetical protein AAL_05522 [Moelleriella libera RCEF 2490]|uniref:Uncharacterized protein n=1 Tax=Moelleriella libera RCEF 2490 TaxID=1081109 RepID=A0A168ADU6_9HYPO|nr:hypothetical protein AAL_05522 [Moelleriella libera RCEF 2490]